MHSGGGSTKPGRLKNPPNQLPSTQTPLASLGLLYSALPDGRPASGWAPPQCMGSWGSPDGSLPSQPHSLLATKPSSFTFHPPSALQLAPHISAGPASCPASFPSSRRAPPGSAALTSKPHFRAWRHHHRHLRQPQDGHSPATGPSVQGGEVPSGTQHFQGRNRSQASGGKTQCPRDGSIAGPQTCDAPPSMRGG